MTEQAKRRKGFDLYLPFKWFNKAWWALAELCVKGAAQHNDGPPQWDRHKSFDHESACLRHFSQLGEIDDDGIRLVLSAFGGSRLSCSLSLKQPN